MKRGLGWIAAVLFAAGGQVLAQASIEVTLELPPQGPSFGEPFLVTVQRSWGPGVEPEPFDDKALAPLSVLLETAGPWPASGSAASTWFAGERRRYRARAFVVGEVRLAAVEFRYRQGGRIGVAACIPAAFAVRSVLPEPPGDIEWPGDVRNLAARGLGPWWLGVLAAVLGSMWWWRQSRQLAAVPPPAAPAPPAHELTSSQLAALLLPEGEATLAAFYAELAEILRGHLQRRFALPAAVRTSQELVAAVPLGREELQGCLQSCDRVKFGALHPAPEQHRVALQSARRFVQATVVAERTP